MKVNRTSSIPPSLTGEIGKPLIRRLQHLSYSKEGTKEIHSWVNKSRFAQEVFEGLSSEKKYIPMKWVYDAKGSKIFEAMTKDKDYYLTRSEDDIFQNQSEKIMDLVPEDKEGISLIELGPGDGHKTEFLIEKLLDSGRKFQYVPIEISRSAVTELTERLSKKFPRLKVEPAPGDYFKELEKRDPNKRNFVLFLGGTLGNYMKRHRKEFLKQLKASLKSGDRVLIGFDLRPNEDKSFDAMWAAYNSKVVDAFDKNYLIRINKELGGQFDLSKFKHYRNYDEPSGGMERYLESTEDQSVYIKALSQRFEFKKNERIYLGQSVKFSKEEISQLAKDNGFKVVGTLKDSKGYFVDSVWELEP